MKKIAPIELLCLSWATWAPKEEWTWARETQHSTAAFSCSYNPIAYTLSFTCLETGHTSSAKAACINVYHYLKIQNSVHIAIFKVLTLLVWNSRYFISNSAAHGNIMCKMHLKSRVPGCWFCFSIIYVNLLDLLCGSIQWIITDIFKQIGERPESVLAV